MEMRNAEYLKYCLAYHMDQSEFRAQIEYINLTPLFTQWLVLPSLGIGVAHRQVGQPSDVFIDTNINNNVTVFFFFSLSLSLFASCFLQ